MVNSGGCRIIKNILKNIYYDDLIFNAADLDGGFKR